MSRTIFESTAEIAPAEVSPAISRVAEDSRALAVEARQMSDLVGDPLPYDRERVIQEYQVVIGHAHDLLIEAGKRVLLIHANEPRADFEAIVQDRLGLSRRAAYNFMAATLRLLQLPARTTQVIGALGRTKLLDLMAATDDEAINALAEGGSVAQLKLDDIDRMSTRELRAALREARENETAQGRVMEEKNRKIDELATRAVRAERKRAVELEEATPDDQRKELMAAVAERAFEAEAQIRGNLRIGIEALLHQAQTSGESAEEYVAGVLCQLERAVREVRAQFGLKAVADGEERPEWVNLDWAREQGDTRPTA